MHMPSTETSQNLFFVLFILLTTYLSASWAMGMTLTVKQMKESVLSVLTVPPDSVILDMPWLGAMQPQALSLTAPRTAL